MTTDPHPTDTATLLISCPDRRGIVAAMAQLLHGYGANILDLDQHTDSLAGIFFQRVRFDLAELQVDRATLERDVIRTTHRDAVQDLVRKGRDVERVVLSRAVRWHLEDRVLAYGNKTVVFA